MRAEEWVAHIAESGDLGGGRVGRRRDGAKIGKRRGEVEWAAKRIEKLKPECAGHACAAVVGRAAAEANQNAASPAVQGVGDELPGAEGLGAERIVFARMEPPQPGGFAHGDDGQIGANPQIAGFDGAAERIGDSRNVNP